MKKILNLKEEYFNSLDYLRVFFAVSIVGWHTKMFGGTGLIASPFEFNVKDFIYGTIFLVGVPVFVQVSFFLYLTNRAKKPDYFLKRIFYLAFLYFFWMAALILIFYKESGFSQFAKIDFWLSGGATPLYFLIVLLILTFVFELNLLLQNLFNKKVMFGLALFFLIVTVGFLVNKSYFLATANPNLANLLSAHWSPINFLPYIFSAQIFYYFYKEGLPKIKAWVLALSAVAILFIAVIEYLYLSNSANLMTEGMIIPPYSRLSIILSTWLIFYVALSSQWPAYAWVKRFAGLTLGIYVLHIFVMNILAGLFPALMEIYRNTFIYFGAVLFISATATYLIREKGIL